jgi:taurine dioxygenase
MLGTAGLTIRRLSPALGAEILDLDLAQGVDDRTFDRIRQAWHEHGVLLFRGQRLSTEDQVRFAARFGELAKNLRDYAGSDHPSVMYISNVTKDGKLIGSLPDGEMLFHSDMCYLEVPCAAALLYAIDVPSRGGNTLFLNAYAAYDALPEDWKQRLAGLKALNVYAPGQTDNTKPRLAMKDAEEPGARSYAHPVVRTHPATGRPSLYVNRLMTAGIVGLPSEESDRTLQFLFDHQEQRRFIYEHVWRPGDLLIWDNRCTLHARTDFNAAERRMLRRVTVVGEKPV